jgi:putative FmdB family regulatory protein
MPTYEYICEKCGYEFEQFQSITARTLRICPKCDKRGLKRLIGAGAGVIFKGSGFYETDYRSESYKKGKKKEKDSTDTKSEKKETKAEAKNKKTDKKAKSDTKNEKKSA